jgi:hypothetical protein
LYKAQVVGRNIRYPRNGVKFINNTNFRISTSNFVFVRLRFI